MAKQGITLKYDRVYAVLGEGNFVLVVSEGHLGGRHSSFYDLFRVQNGKIVEHWDTIEPIPTKSEWIERERKNSDFSVAKIRDPSEIARSRTGTTARVWRRIRVQYS
jgi:hypothetical protein